MPAGLLKSALATSDLSPYALVGILICPSRVRAIASTMPLGSVGYEAEVGPNGERLIWLAPNVVGRLRASPARAYSNVI